MRWEGCRVRVGFGRGRNKRPRGILCSPIAIRKQNLGRTGIKLILRAGSSEAGCQRDAKTTSFLDRSRAQTQYSPRFENLCRRLLPRGFARGRIPELSDFSGIPQRRIAKQGVLSTQAINAIVKTNRIPTQMIPSACQNHFANVTPQKYSWS